MSRFDRNIFNGTGEEKELVCNEDTELRVFYDLRSVIPTILDKEIKFKARVYPAFRRKNFLPIQFWVGNEEFCGWVDLNKITLVS